MTATYTGFEPTETAGAGPSVVLRPEGRLETAREPRHDGGPVGGLERVISGPLDHPRLERPRELARIVESVTPGRAVQPMELSAERVDERGIGWRGHESKCVRTKNLHNLACGGAISLVEGAKSLAVGLGRHGRGRAMGRSVLQGSRHQRVAPQSGLVVSMLRTGSPDHSHTRREWSSMRLLCADDEEDIRAILRLALSLDPDLEVEIVESGQEAIARAATGHFDAIVLDGMMPGLDGYETCRRLKADPVTASVPVIFLTAKTHRDETQRALRMGAVACLTKPFDPMTVAREVRAALETRKAS